MSRSASEVLSQEFLQIRAKILEIAAFYDRLEQADSARVDEGSLNLLRQGCQLLSDDQDDKAARVQLLFSREYDPQWRQQFDI
ncbi:MAG: hypothetical protein KDA45_14690 [Planctomycetales bacterium]|nr:hypothetical protein [Planctomycetales bacterium]